ncbi:hypothetical protein VL10_23375 [Leclercia adecarboxylata]|nr:hypothetical protein VL10_23375 [Leclercia adecarboxylata]KMN66824.1 hypothetical protein VK95_04335 [Leclercia sp. LK8]
MGIFHHECIGISVRSTLIKDKAQSMSFCPGMDQTDTINSDREVLINFASLILLQLVNGIRSRLCRCAATR